MAQERDIISDIKNIRDFNSYLVNFTHQVIKPKTSVWIKYGALDSPPEDPRPWVFVSVPWTETPLSLQKAMRLQFPSVSRGNITAVNIRINIPQGHLSFTPQSQSVVHVRYGETYYCDLLGKIVTPKEGLLLSFRPLPIVPERHWVATKIPADAAGVRAVLTGKIRPSTVKPATLGELHDIVRTLEDRKDTACWGETLPPAF